MAEPVEWNAEQLKAFAKSLRHDKDGRELKLKMQAQFDSITESLRDRLRQGVKEIPRLGSYPDELAESVQFKTKIIGGNKARVSIVGEGRTSKGKWREVGKLLDSGFLFHPAWGRWRAAPPPSYLREEVPAAPQMVTSVLAGTEPGIRDDIRAVLSDYLDKLTELRNT